MNEHMLIPGFSTYRVSIETKYSNLIDTVIAKTRSGAIYKMFSASSLSEMYKYAEFMKNKEIVKKVKKLYPAKLEDLFKSDQSIKYCQQYRKMEFLELGMKVQLYDGSFGYIIGCDDNLLIYSTDNNESFVIHPTWESIYYDEDDNIIANYKN